MPDDLGFVPDNQATAPSSTEGTPTPPADLGFVPDDQKAAKHHALQEQYGTPFQQAFTAAEGISQGVLGPLGTLAEKAIGIPKEEVEARQAANPITHGLSEASGFVGSLFLDAGLPAIIGKAGSAVKAGTKAMTVSRLAPEAAKVATEMALFQTGNEVSKMINEDPNQTLDSAIANVGLASAIGAGGGALLALPGPLWEKTVGSKLGNLAEDFKGRLNYHLENPDPMAAISKELENHYGMIKGMSDEVYGPSGLKAQDIAKAMPEMNDAIRSQYRGINDKLAQTLNKMESSPSKFPARLMEEYRDTISKFGESSLDAASPAELYNSVQDLKQQFQEYAKFGKFVKPVDEAYNFVKVSRELASDLRSSLEDSGVWGKAAERQQSINKAFSEFLPSLKDFEKRFTTTVGEDRVVDPGKINSYVSQLGKPNAEIKQEMLDNFLKASEKYRNVISDTHSNLGLESPFQPIDTHVSNLSVDSLSQGAKLADALVNKNLSKMVGHGLAGAIGGTAGKLAGFPLVGALIGERALGPFLESVLPALTRTMLKTESSPAALKTAVDYSMQAARGLTKINDIASAVVEKKSLDIAMPSSETLSKLNEKLLEYQVNPDSVSLASGNLQHYMPDHAMTVGYKIGSVASYLSAQRPDTAPMGPLGKARPVSGVEQAAWKRTLTLAQQPLAAMKFLSQGRLTSKDIKDLDSMYPSLAANLRQRLLAQVMERHVNGKTIPYEQRVQLSGFIGQSLDPSLDQATIASAQAVFASKYAASQQPPQGVKPPSAAKTSSLKGIASLDALPDHSKGQRRQLVK